MRTAVKTRTRRGPGQGRRSTRAPAPRRLRPLRPGPGAAPAVSGAAANCRFSPGRARALGARAARSGHGGRRPRRAGRRRACRLAGLRALEANETGLLRALCASAVVSRYAAIQPGSRGCGQRLRSVPRDAAVGQDTVCPRGSLAGSFRWRRRLGGARRHAPPRSTSGGSWTSSGRSRPRSGGGSSPTGAPPTSPARLRKPLPEDTGFPDRVGGADHAAPARSSSRWRWQARGQTGERAAAPPPGFPRFPAHGAESPHVGRRSADDPGLPGRPYADQAGAGDPGGHLRFGARRSPEEFTLHLTYALQGSSSPGSAASSSSTPSTRSTGDPGRGGRHHGRYRADQRPRLRVAA